MKPVLYMAALTVLTAVFLASAPHPAPTECCPEPLFNWTSRDVPEKLSWYFIVVFGDNRAEDTRAGGFPPAFQAVLREVEALNPYAVVGTGDHVGEGREYQYRALWTNMSGLPNVLLVPGNHDMLISGSEDRWTRYVGPRYWVWEEVPGWSVIGVDTTDRLLQRFKDETRRVFESSRGPHRILVIHYPIEPWVDHNIDDAPSGATKARLLKELILEYNVSIVLEGHWHGYAMRRVNSTLYVITGGAGAPFYTIRTSETDADYYRTFLHHYVVLVLRPDGNYTVLPVYLDKGSVSVRREGPSRVLVRQDKFLVNGSEALLPFRVSLERDNVNITVQFMAPHASNISITLESGNPVKIRVDGQVSMLEAYYTGTGEPVRLVPAGNGTYVEVDDSHKASPQVGYSPNSAPEVDAKAGASGTRFSGSARPSDVLLRWETVLALSVVALLILVKRLS